MKYRKFIINLILSIIAFYLLCIVCVGVYAVIVSYF